MQNQDSNDASLRKRVETLEVQLAHTMRLVDQLNEVVTEHASAAVRYDRLFHTMGTQLRELKDSPPDSIGPADEKPPHY